VPDTLIEELADGECRALLAGRRLGRLALAPASVTGRSIRIPDEPMVG
jgi:hypothetical protein